MVGGPGPGVVAQSFGFRLISALNTLGKDRKMARKLQREVSKEVTVNSEGGQATKNANLEKNKLRNQS